MGQRSDYATVKDVLINFRREECVSSMEQSSNDAATKDAQIKLGKEEYARGMGHTAILARIVFDQKNLMMRLG